MKRFLIVLALLVPSLWSCASSTPTAYSSRSGMSSNEPSLRAMLQAGPSQVQASAAEEALYHMIMDYRKNKGLPSIPLSKSLTYVAKLHVRDLDTHTFPSPANAHSWSADGPWKSVMYTPDHAQARLMWDKPRELTRYPGNGFEIASTQPGGATPQTALASWKSSKLHNAVMVNEGIWEKNAWQAIGVGIYRGHAVVWFGSDVDPE